MRGARGFSWARGDGPSAVVAGRALWAWVLFVVVALDPWGLGLARAEFNEPVRITDGSGSATDVVIGFDVANNAYVVSVVGDRIIVNVIGPNLDSVLEIPATGLPQGEPAIVNSSRGEAFVCFSQADPDPGDVGRDICMTHNSGGSFVPPVHVSDNRLDDHSPTIALDEEGIPQLAWVRTVGEASHVIFYDHATQEEVDIGEGSYPSIHVDLAGVSHLVYSRDNDLFYVNNASGRFENELPVVRTPTSPEYNAEIGGTETGRLFVSFEAGGSAYLVDKPRGAPFEVPILLDNDGILEPQLRVKPAGGLSVVYSKQGDLFFVQGVSSSFLVGPNPVGEPSSEVESRPGLVVDACGIGHAVFLRDGEVYYTNNAGEIDADFTADVRTGEVPLRVVFQDISNGKVQSYRWDFGDGEQGTGRAPAHVYSEPGTYTVTLTVNTADRESVERKREFIVAQEPNNVMWVPNQRVKQGQSDVWFPVKAQHNEPVMAFQVHGRYDPAILRFTDCSLEWSVTTHFTPEVWECNLFEGRFEVGCIFDFVPPFDGRRLPPGDDHTLAHLVADVPADAPAGTVTRVDLLNDREISPIFNIFTVNNVSRLPVLRGATVSIAAADDPGTLFIRGDVNNSGRVDITDGIRLLNFLFLGEAAPDCLDAADPQDAGRVDISGAIYLLNFLFLGGPNPDVPFPALGLDPSPDDLGCD